MMNIVAIMRKMRNKSMEVERKKYGFQSVPFYEHMTGGSRGRYHFYHLYEKV